MDSKDKGSYDNTDHKLIDARKRLVSLQGPSISFKRPRQETQPRATSSLSNSYNPATSLYGYCPNVSDRYKKVGRIGEGTYGIVYKAIDQRTQNVVALKRCLPHHQESDGFPITTLREIEILREISLVAQEHDTRCKTKGMKELNGSGSKCKPTEEEEIPPHDNIVSLLEVAVGSKSSSVFLVFEYVHFDLAKLIDEHYAKYSKSPFTSAETKCLTRQLFSAISFLHERCIIHRDLKLSNLLYDKSRGLLKLADFGLARKIIPSEGSDNQDTKTFHHHPHWRPDTPPTVLTPKVVSLWYRPPELLLNADNYAISIDMWAAGCIVAELLLGQPLFRGKNDLDQLSKIVGILGAPCVGDWPGILDMPLVKSGSVELPFSLASAKSNDNRMGQCTSRGLLDVFSTLSKGGIEMLVNLLRYDPAQRWSGKQCANCLWFREYPRPTHSAFMPKFDHKL